MKIATWNVNSVGARLPLVLRWLAQARPAALCLQETKCVDEKFPAAAFAELGYHSLTHGQPTYNGVAILSREAATETQRGFPDDEAGAHARLIEATVGDVKIVNVYVPNGAFVGADKYKFKLDWLKRLRARLDASYSTTENVLLCGDFNVAPEDRDVHDPDLWRGKILCSRREREAMEHVRKWGFADAFRLHTEDAGHYSWWDYRAGSFRRDAGLRIDHVWVSPALVARSRATWIDREPRGWERPSDHAPVVAEFDLD